MKRIFLIGAILSLIGIHSIGQDAIRKNYVVTKPAVSTLKIEGDINVTLVVAPNEPEIFVDGSENFTKNVRSSIDGAMMHIKATSGSRTEKDVVFIYAPSLSHIELIGDVKFKTIGTLDADNVDLSINGNCKLSVQHAGKLNITLDDNYELVEKRETRLKLK